MYMLYVICMVECWWHNTCIQLRTSAWQWVLCVLCNDMNFTRRLDLRTQLSCTVHAGVQKKKKTQNYGCLRQALIIGISLYSFISSSSGGDIFGMLSCRLCALMHSKQVTCSGFADGFMEEHWWCFWRDKLRWSVIILFWVHVFLAICLSPAGQRSGQVACPRATDTDLCCHFQNFNSIGDLSAGILMVILNCCYINMTFKLCF